MNMTEQKPDTQNTERTKITPAEFRRSAGLSQNQLSRATELSLNAVQNAESKRSLFYSTAKKIVDAVNFIRVNQKELPAVGLDDIDWTFR